MSSSVPVLTRRSQTLNLPSHVTTFKKLIFTLFDLVPRRTKWRMTSSVPACQSTSSASTSVFLLCKDCGKKVGANDEVLIASSSTTTSATSLQWRRVSTWCSTTWWRWSSRRRLWWTIRKCLVPIPTLKKLLLVCLLQASQTAKSFVSYCCTN